MQGFADPLHLIYCCRFALQSLVAGRQPLCQLAVGLHEPIDLAELVEILHLLNTLEETVD